MNILIFNCGSSSQGFKVYRAVAGKEAQVVAGGKARNVATRTQAQAAIEWQVGGESGALPAELPSHRAAAEQILALLSERQVPVDAIGHRFVHGGPFFERTVRIDAAALKQLKQCLPFAPIHNPNSYSVIQVCLERLPGVAQFAAFDTAFHAGLSAAARPYAIPMALAEKHGFRKYGFHGLSYRYLSGRLSERMGRPLSELKLIICHLGTGGSSVAAIQDGKTLETSMGYSPLPGLVMSTRCGDIDAEIVLELVRQGHSADEVSAMLNNQSGLIGLSGYSSNLQEVIEAGEQGNAACALAYEVYARRLNTYLGAYTWLLGGADAIAFSDDVGLKSWKLRAKVCSGVERLGVELDPDANRTAPLDRATRVSAASSSTQVWVLPTDEESVILQEVLALL